MATKTKATRKSAIPQPAFAPGCVISHRSIYVDANGHAWLVDPQTAEIKRIRPHPGQ